VSLFIDHNYIAQISSRLDRFKRKTQRSYNFRCPFCHDSSKSKIKARGYFFTKGNNISFYCHNCLQSKSFSQFLKEFDPSLYEKYIFENYREKNPEEKKENFDEFNFKPEFKEHLVVDILSGCTNIDELPLDHYARKYIQGRQIPKVFWKDIWYVPDFKELVDKVEPENEYNLKPKDPRIIFPFRDKEKRITAIQGRSFQNRGLRFIIVKIDKDSPKVFGLDRVDPENRVYICEGTVDSFFLTNAIACAGSHLCSYILPNCHDMVYLLDNEPRNKAIIDQMKKIADSGKKLCVWPETVGEKDINDLILAGYTSEKIVKIINANTYTGLSARIAINEWKRC